MSGEKGRNRKIYIVIAITIVLTLVVMTGMNMVLDYRLKIENGKNTPDAAFGYHIALISQNPSDVLWDSIYQGAVEEGGKVDSFVENFGADLSVSYSTEELMRMAIAASVDGIIVEANGSEELTDLIDEAEKEGIPVVTILQDAPNSKRKSFVSANDYALGELYGNQVAAAVQEFGQEEQEPCKVSVLVNTKDANGTPNLIYSGISEVVGSSAQNVSLSSVTIDGEGNFKSEETIRSMILNQEERPDIMVCLSAIDTISAYQSIIDYNLVGKIQVIGYYFSPEILEGIQKGIIRSSVAINAAEMGQDSVRGLHEYITEKYVSEYLPVASELITKNNAERYMEKDEE